MSEASNESEKSTSDDTPKFICTNSECKAYNAILEIDEIVTENGSTGTCCYCGQPVQPAPEEEKA